VIPPRAGPSRECRHLFARGGCHFHERSRRSGPIEQINFGGAPDPRLARPAWVDAVPREPGLARPRRWREWAAEVGRRVRAWARAVVEQESVSSPWMASEAIAGGEPLWPAP